MENQDIYKFIKNIVKDNDLNKLPDEYGSGAIFSEPLIGIAKGNDPIFNKYKEIISEKHFTPAELWLAHDLSNKENLASKLRILSIVFPFSREIREKSIDKRKMPAEIYCVGRNYANVLIPDVLKKIIAFLEEKGYNGTSRIDSEVFNITIQRKYPYLFSNWSERHIAFAAGLGTFSLHEGLITEKGCNIRLGSVVTDAPLEVTPRRTEDPYANCLFYAKGTCKKCVERCPGGALSEEGHDKWKCTKYEQMVAEKMHKRLGNILIPHWRRINGIYKEQRHPPVGCAFCQFNVPCMDKNPLKSKND
ncbi:MAG: putative Fe-S protein [Promethearchaeota archaeon]|nr:MAG: putative Fe-S protein [Candidatus Lokiarchaeota archaeon]